MPKIMAPAYGDLTAYLASFTLIGHDPTEGSVTDQTKRLELGDLVTMLNDELSLIPSGSGMVNGKLSATVSSNDLVVAVKTLAGSNPSATDKVYININGTVREVVAATSITIADGTNWFASGGAPLGTLLVPYFAYAVWDSNSSVVALSISRYAHGRLVSDFSTTTTDQAHLYNFTNFTSTDDVVNIGYFEATLSLSGTSHLWTVPTFTSTNLRHVPTFRSRRMTWAPAPTGYSSVPTSVVYEYVVDNNFVELFVREAADGTSNATTLTFTAPFVAATLTNMTWGGFGWGRDNTASLTTTVRLDAVSASATVTAYPNGSASATWTAGATGKRIAEGYLKFPIG